MDGLSFALRACRPGAAEGGGQLRGKRRLAPVFGCGAPFVTAEKPPLRQII